MDPQFAMEQSHAGSPLPALIVMGIIGIFFVAVMWKVFTKAGEPGWAAIVPLYNLYVLLKIAGKPAWWMLLFLVPVVSLVISILVAISIAQRFGKGTGFGLGLAFLGPIFYPVLAFGSAEYQGDRAALA